MDQDSKNIIEWLKKQEPNKVIEWVDDHITREKPWCSSWVDVRVPAAEKELKTNWVWTIVALGDEDAQENPESIWQIQLRHDLDVYSIFKVLESGGWDYMNEIAVSNGQKLALKQEIELDLAEEKNRPCKRSLLGGWSASAVSGALERWANEHAGRPDIVFRWNPDLPDSKFLQKARDVAEKIRSVEEEIYNIGDGIHVSGQAFDFLLQDFDRAEKITEKLKEIIKEEK